jgi:serine/threonine protein kinase
VWWAHRVTSPPSRPWGRPVDHRTDVYGAAGVLYALLVGHDPFSHRRAAYEVLRAHLGEAPRPPSVALGQPLPPGLDAVVLRGLEKHPDARFPSAAAFAEALLPFVAVAEPPRRPEPAPPVAEVDSQPPSLARLALWTALSTVVALAVAQAWMAVFGPLF